MQKMQCMGKNHTHFGQEPHFSRPARFRVSAAENVREFKLQSGDALAFDPSSAAGIAHREVCGIGEAETCPAGLGERFAELRRFRYGVQCRVRF